MTNQLVPELTGAQFLDGLATQVPLIEAEDTFFVNMIDLVAEQACASLDDATLLRLATELADWDVEDNIGGCDTPKESAFCALFELATNTLWALTTHEAD